MKKLPLEGIRVLDFGQMWAGPHGSEWLSVMGAEVIKVETNLKIDFMRTVGAPAGLAGTGPNVGSAFATLNWGKKSISINMNEPRARELVKKLIKICDVITENFGGAVLDRWGLSFAELQKIKPDIILLAGTGYGRNGPYKERPAYAEIVDAYDGSTFANGYLGEDPAVVGISPWTDGNQALNCAFAVLSALYHRQQTGEGQYLEAAMIEGSSSFLSELVMGYMINGRVGKRSGNRDAFMAPHGCYPCQSSDGEPEWVAIAVASQKEWKALCKVMGNPAWTKKEEFADELNRWKNQDQLDKYLSGWTGLHGCYDAAEKLQKAGVTASPSLSTKQLTHDRHINEREFFIKTEHPVLGKVLLTGLPYNLSESPKGNYDCPPLLGEDNDYVFGELLGMGKEEIKKLVEEKVLY
jgi:benzylsuccinate CoA-transferase BbsF subunit